MSETNPVDALRKYVNEKRFGHVRDDTHWQLFTALVPLLDHVDAASARVAELEAKLAEMESAYVNRRAGLENERAALLRLRDTDECWVARPGEGTLECRHDRLCPTCRVRNAEAEAARLREENRRLGELLAEYYEALREEGRL